MIFGGVLDLFPIINDYDFDLFSKNTISNMSWIKNNTKTSDIFLSFNGDTMFVLGAGRKEFISGGYYIWSLGYPSNERYQELQLFNKNNFSSYRINNYLWVGSIIFNLFSKSYLFSLIPKN